MNTKGLEKLYDRLTPEERLPLIIVASARKDERECMRLADSAPREGYELPDYYGYAEGLVLASLFHLIELFDLAVLYWQASGLAADWSHWGGEEGETPSGRLHETARVAAHVFTVKMDGWRSFCLEAKIDPDKLLSDLPGIETIRRTEQVARFVACSADEANRWLRSMGSTTDGVVTPEDAAESIRQFVLQRKEWWD